MQITFRPMLDDYVAAARGNYIRRLVSLKTWLGICVGCTVVIGALVILTLQAGESLDSLLPSTAIGAVGGVVCALLLVALNFLLLPGRVEKLFEQSKSQHQEMSFGWSPEGIFWETVNGSQRLPWSHYHRWRETGSVYLLYLNDTLYQFVPRHILTTEQDADLRATFIASGLSRH